MQADSVKKTLIVALGVCLVCSVLVSSATVALRDRQNENKKIDKLKNILMAGQLLEDETKIEETYNEKVKPVIIDLATGETEDVASLADILKPENYDIKKVANDADYGKVIPAEQDIAGIRRMPAKMNIYEVVQQGQVQKYILPIYGKGLWSTMYGFIAIDKDLHTIQGITFYEHGETPGLGGEIDNPRWKAQWTGKQAFDESWNVKITVLKGLVDPSNSDAKYQIDGLSGSTLTTRGVDATIKFWLGDQGYGPFISKLRGGVNEQI